MGLSEGDVRYQASSTRDADNAEPGLCADWGINIKEKLT